MSQLCLQYEFECLTKEVEENKENTLHAICTPECQPNCMPTCFPSCSPRCPPSPGPAPRYT
jgi:hypothetical protein